MTKRHAPSFLFSLIVHIVALLILFYTYKYVVYLKNQQSQKKICVNLNLCVPENRTAIKKIKKTKEIKKVSPKKIEKKRVKKIVPRKVKKKNDTPPKKEPLLTAPVIKKKSEKPKEIVKEVSKIKVEKQENRVKEALIKNDVKSSEPIKEIPNLAATEEKQYINNNLLKISQLLSDNLYYPRRARKRGIVGEVVVKFDIQEDGNVNRVKIISSKSKILAKAAIKTIENLSGLFPKPNQKLTIQIPIQYRLQ